MSMLAIADLWNYYVVIFLMMAGLFVVISRQNLVKKLVGLSIFQTSVFLFYITLGKMAGGTAPILIDDPSAVYSNPLPHVLILTAIVVGVATTALGLALVLRINEAFGSIEEDVLLEATTEAALERPNRRRTAIKDSKQNDS